MCNAWLHRDDGMVSKNSGRECRLGLTVIKGSRNGPWYTKLPGNVSLKRFREKSSVVC